MRLKGALLPSLRSVSTSPSVKTVNERSNVVFFRVVIVDNALVISKGSWYHGIHLTCVGVKETGTATNHIMLSAWFSLSAIRRDSNAIRLQSSCVRDKRQSH